MKAKVKQTQYRRLEGTDKCVLQTTDNMEGLPFSDCFNVDVRWVATRLTGKKCIALQVGLVVHFVKPTM
jgi:hypothetical protein